MMKKDNADAAGENYTTVVPASAATLCVCGHGESMHNPDAEPDTCHGDNDTCQCRGFMDARAAKLLRRNPFYGVGIP